jgi:hypothetical protein
MKIAFINGNIYKKFNPVEICDSFVVENEKIIFTGKKRSIKNR